MSPREQGRPGHAVSGRMLRIAARPVDEPAPQLFFASLVLRPSLRHSSFIIRHSAGAAVVAGFRPAHRAENARRASRLRRRHRVVPRATGDADSAQLAEVPEEHLRLRSEEGSARAARRSVGQGERRRVHRAGRSGHGADRAHRVHLRDHRHQRADEHADEPRVRPHRDDGRARGERSVLPEAVRRQGAADRGAAGVDSVFLPDVAARGGAALVSRRHRRLLRHLDGRRARTRAERVRRDGLPLDGRRQRAVLRSAGPGL